MGKVKELSTPMGATPIKKELHEELEECDVERFFYVESMEFVGTELPKEHREIPLPSGKVLSIDDDGWESHEDTKVQLESERVNLLDWWRYCKELLRPLEDASKKMIPSIIKPPQLELKPLPKGLKYEYLKENNTLSVIISTCLTLE